MKLDNKLNFFRKYYAPLFTSWHNRKISRYFRGLSVRGQIKTNIQNGQMSTVKKWRIWIGGLRRRKGVFERYRLPFCFRQIFRFTYLSSIKLR